jgi:leader peptidase (prepilin peptidase)/N-methyltransferase
VLGYIDWQTRLLPTRIIAPSYAVLVVLLAVAVTIERDLDPALRSVYGWLAFGGFYLLLWFVYPRGLGYGDVRLSGLLGLALGYLGWGPVLTGMYAGFLIGGVGGGLLAAFRLFDRKHFPFGPFMLIGALVGLVWGQAFADWYSGF